MGDNPGVGEWADHTTNEERVRAVACAVQSPWSAAWITSEAQVDNDTSQKLLDRLMMDIQQTVSVGGKETNGSAWLSPVR